MTPFNHFLRSVARVFSVALVSAAMTSQASAQERFPTESIKIVVPYPAGGSVDRLARIFGEQLGKELGQAVVIDNRPGAGTNIGAEAVIRSKADGHTLLFASSAQVLNPIFGPAPSFDALASLEPLSLVSRVHFMLAANLKAPFNNGSQLLAAAKAAPDKISVGSAQADLYVELLNEKARMRLLHIPYKGGAPATTDAIGGQITAVFSLLPVLMPQIQGGKLKPIAVTSAKRLSALPDVATFTELGVDYDVSVWYGLMAPAGTPKFVVDRLAGVTEKIMATPDMAQKMRAGGAEPAWNKPEEFKALLRADTLNWKQVAKTLPHLVQK
jgi:tripartite-type tricarboxylate transporter receptor subunit TctC